MSPTARRWTTGLFIALLAGWTWLLVEPHPIPPVVEVVPPAWRFVAAKTLHASVYTGLTVLGLIWPGTPFVRRVVIVGLLAHGVATEVIQTFVPNRTGRAADVLIDWAGIGVGLTAVRYLMFSRLNGPPVFPTPRSE
jgi:VanZ family protein